MKLPIRIAGRWLLLAVDAGFEIAQRIAAYLEKRKAEKTGRGLSFRDVQHQQDQIARATRQKAPTVVVRRPKP